MGAGGFIFRCVTCGKEFSGSGIRYLCPHCSKSNTSTTPPKGVLKVIYDYDEIRGHKQSGQLFEALKNAQFIDILPIRSAASFSPLKVGNTPVYHFLSDTLVKGHEKHHVFFKDDALNPTFSHKDRASNLVSAWAKENGTDTIAAASTGNAGSSIAGICASQGQKAIVMVPAKAPKAKLLQIMQYGARIVPVDGTYDDAFELSLKVSEKYGFYNRNTAFNPFTIEGKKTAALEIFNDLGCSLPDFLFVSVGDGVIVSGLYKGFEDLMQLGITDRVPSIVAVQSEKSKNLLSNLHTDNFIIYPSTTIADSISVDVPRNFFMAKDFLLKYKGTPILVTDEEIIEASRVLSLKTGIFSEPAASAAYAGYLKFINSHPIQKGSRVVVLLTGSGLKDLKNIEKLHQMPESIKADVNNFLL